MITQIEEKEELEFNDKSQTSIVKVDNNSN